MKNWLEKDYPKEEKIRKNNVGKELETKLNKIYPPDSKIDGVFKGKDVTFITNSQGIVMSFHYGKRKENGEIQGDSFFRRIKKEEGGKIIESHWDKQNSR